MFWSQKHEFLALPTKSDSSKHLGHCVADVPGVRPVPLLAAAPHPRVPAEHRLPLPRDALPPAGAHRNGENVQYSAR